MSNEQSVSPIPERYRDVHAACLLQNSNYIVHQTSLAIIIQELGAEEAKVTALEATNAELRAEIDDDNSAVRTVARDCRLQDEAMIAALQSEVTALEAQLSAFQDEAETQVEESEKEIAALEAANRGLQDDLIRAQSSAVKGVGALEALEMLYDKYENGDPCTENGDEYGSVLGNCVRLSAEEEDSILTLIPAQRNAKQIPSAAETPAPLGQIIGAICDKIALQERTMAATNLEDRCKELQAQVSQLQAESTQMQIKLAGYEAEEAHMQSDLTQVQERERKLRETLEYVLTHTPERFIRRTNDAALKSNTEGQ